MMKCAKCGAANSKGENFCAKCGASLATPAVSKKPTPLNPSQQNNTFYLLAALIAVIGVVVIAIVLSQPAPPVVIPYTPPAFQPYPASLDDIYAGLSVSCLLEETMEDDGEISILRMGVLWEYPMARMEMSGEGTDMGMELVPDYVTLSDDFVVSTSLKDFSTGQLYANMPEMMFGPYWWDMTGSGDDEAEVPPPEVMFGEDPDDGIFWGYMEGFDCTVVRDIPDSEFQLPANAIVKDASQYETLLSEDVGDALLGHINMDYIDQGYALFCFMKGTYGEIQVDELLLVEYPKYAEYESETEVPVSIFDGSRLYGYTPSEGVWYDVTDLGYITDAKVLIQQYEAMNSGEFTFFCIPASDIADYKFQLPTEAQILDYEQPQISIEDALDQGYSVKCRSEAINTDANVNHVFYFEAPKYYVEDWEDGYIWLIHDGESWWQYFKVASGGRKWFDITNDPDEFQHPHSNFYDSFTRKAENGEISFDCQIVDDIPDSMFENPME